MLLEFSIENVKSFNKMATLSMISTEGRELPDHIRCIKKSKNSKIAINRLASIFGANASGKSNLLSAFWHMRMLILRSGLRIEPQNPQKAHYPLPYLPFLLTNEEKDKPSTFQVLFSHTDKIYRYGFSNNSNAFIREWLYSIDPSIQNESLIFNRDSGEVQFGKNVEIQEYAKHLTDKSLFLTILAELKIELYKDLIVFFQNIQYVQTYNINIQHIVDVIDADDFDIISNVLRFIDTGLSSVKKESIPIEELPLDELPEEIKKFIHFLRTNSEAKEYSFKLSFDHDIYEQKNNSKKTIALPAQYESRGTIACIGILAQIIASLKNNKLLIIDEIDASLHPFLVEGIINLFINTQESNSQFIFTSHCPFIFDKNKIRRDELWITEKNNNGESRLISADEFKARTDGNLIKQYFEGKFGGIPILQHQHLKLCSHAIDELIRKQSDDHETL